MCEIVTGSENLSLQAVTSYNATCKTKTPDEIPSVGKERKKNLKQQTVVLRRKLKTNQSQSVAVSHLCAAPSEGDTWRGNRGTSSSHAGFLQFTSGADGS